MNTLISHFCPKPVRYVFCDCLKEDGCPKYYGELMMDFYKIIDPIFDSRWVREFLEIRISLCTNRLTVYRHHITAPSSMTMRD